MADQGLWCSGTTGGQGQTHPQALTMSGYSPMDGLTGTMSSKIQSSGIDKRQDSCEEHRKATKRSWEGKRTVQICQDSFSGA